MFTIPDHKGNEKIKTTLRFYFTPRMATIKNTNNNKCWQGYWGKGTLILLVGM
jgi:hypothetical protein